jgi:hypothetical protein
VRDVLAAGFDLLFAELGQEATLVTPTAVGRAAAMALNFAEGATEVVVRAIPEGAGTEAGRPRDPVAPRRVAGGSVWLLSTPERTPPVVDVGRTRLVVGDDSWRVVEELHRGPTSVRVRVDASPGAGVA